MTSPENDVAAIANSLSEPQRGMILRARAILFDRPPAIRGPSNTRTSLQRSGLASGIFLTPLGLAVRAHLESSK